MAHVEGRKKYPSFQLPYGRNEKDDFVGKMLNKQLKELESDNKGQTMMPNRKRNSLITLIH